MDRLALGPQQGALAGKPARAPCLRSGRTARLVVNLHNVQSGRQSRTTLGRLASALAAKSLTIPRQLFERMLEHCRAEWPREACGIMTGRDGAVRRAFAMRNAHPQPASRYQIDPADQQVAMQNVLAGREELVAIYHSHPTTAAYPSQTDVAMAHYPDAFYIIVSLAREPGDVQAFRIADGQVHRATLRHEAARGEWVDLR